MAAPSTPPEWRRAFLRELARGSSATAAARAVGIDRTTAYQARKVNPAFAASWQRALDAARERPAGERPRLSAGPPREERIVRPSKSGRPCVVRAGPGRWSASVERLFLTELTATANVRAAARAAGVSKVAAYNRRKNWPAFAAQWDEALEEGYVRLETLLVYAATATLDPEPVEDVGEPPPMTVSEAMNLLKLHRARQHGGRPQRYAWR